MPSSSDWTSRTWPDFISLILFAVLKIGMGQASPTQSRTSSGLMSFTSMKTSLQPRMNTGKMLRPDSRFLCVLCGEAILLLLHLVLVARFRRHLDRRRHALLLIIVVERGLERLFSKHRTVHLHLGQAAEGLGHRGVRNIERLVDALALHQVRYHAARGDRRAAPEGLELGLGDDVILDLDIETHHIPAHGVAHGAHAVGVLDLTHVVRMGEMVHDFRAVLFHTILLSGLFPS